MHLETCAFNMIMVQVSSRTLSRDCILWRNNSTIKQDLPVS